MTGPEMSPVTVPHTRSAGERPTGTERTGVLLERGPIVILRREPLKLALDGSVDELCEGPIPVGLLLRAQHGRLRLQL